METPWRICVVTGSRAEYGLLRWVMEGIRREPSLDLQIIATGSHLSPAFGSTYREIEQDGFRVDRKVDILTGDDSATGVVAAMARALAGVGEALAELRPHLAVVLGDRYEIMAAAQAAMVLGIPLAHLCGGDTAVGTYDNIIRHCITKMACLHFVTHPEARDRVVQLGESPDRVFCYGATCVDGILKVPLLSRAELEADLGLALDRKVLLVTFHPLTMSDVDPDGELEALLEALDQMHPRGEFLCLFTKCNADNGGRRFNGRIAEYVQGREFAHLFDSLGQRRYLSLARQAAAVVGNSSSGIYEVPYLGVPTVDIGERQQGRAAPATVVHCAAEPGAIRQAIQRALELKLDGVPMIYGDGGSSERIVAKLKEMVQVPGLALKAFVDLPAGGRPGRPVSGG